MSTHHQVVIYGASGYTGKLTAWKLAERGIPFRLYEAGARIGTNLLDWAHVRIFTTWEQSVDPVSRALLEARGWAMPRADALPTGGDLCDQYLEPLSRVAGLAAAIETDAKVTAISRQPR